LKNQIDANIANLNLANVNRDPMNKLSMSVLYVLIFFVLVMQIASIFVFSENIRQIPEHIVVSLNNQFDDMEINNAAEERNK
jgi:hypothetical protein